MNEQAQEGVEDARFILENLGFDAERSNERSALVLLALLHLTPGDGWEQATAPMLGTRAIMDWIRDEYGVSYAANTRETIRRLRSTNSLMPCSWRRIRTSRPGQ